VSVPRSKCFVTFAGDVCPLPSSFLPAAAWEQELREDWNVKLALRLLHEHRLGHASAWAPFIASLPRTFQTARNMPDQMLQALQGMMRLAGAWLHAGASWVVLPGNGHERRVRRPRCSHRIHADA
jgi:hypothetical protein